MVDFVNVASSHLFNVDLVVMESDWLTRLEKKLEKSPRTVADAEEASGLLDVSLREMRSQ